MNAEGRRHLADLAEEALANGFERFEIERTVREMDGVDVDGWRLRVGGGVHAGTAERFIVEDALKDPRYVPQLAGLLGMWAEHGIPDEDRAGVVLQGPIWASTTSDLGFMIGVFARGTDAQREIIRAMLTNGIPPLLLAAAVREAFEAPDQGEPA